MSILRTLNRWNSADKNPTNRRLTINGHITGHCKNRPKIQFLVPIYYILLY